MTSSSVAHRLGSDGERKLARGAERLLAKFAVEQPIGKAQPRMLVGLDSRSARRPAKMPTGDSRRPARRRESEPGRAGPAGRFPARDRSAVDRPPVRRYCRPPPAGRKIKRWQKRLARWMLCVSRVSIQTCSESLSSSRLSRHQAGRRLPATRTSNASPSWLQAIRTSANDGARFELAEVGQPMLFAQFDAPAPTRAADDAGKGPNSETAAGWGAAIRSWSVYSRVARALLRAIARGRLSTCSRSRAGQVAAREVFGLDEAQLDHVALRAGMKLAVGGQAGQPAERKASLRAGQLQVEAGLPLGEQAGPRLVLSRHEDMDHLLVVPQELPLRCGRGQALRTVLPAGRRSRPAACRAESPCAKSAISGPALSRA